MLSRRTFVALATTLAATWKRALAQTSQTEWDRRMLAVRVLRLVNTTQHWHHSIHGEFLNLPELLQSEEITYFQNTDDDPRYGMGRSLFDSINLGSRDVFSGARLTLFGQSDGYLAVISDKAKGWAFSTDDDALIYEGRALSLEPDRLNAQVKAAFVLKDAYAIGSVRHSFPVRLLQAAGRLLLVQCYTYCIESFPCVCCGSCQGSYEPPGCRNCGCIDCPWCCRIYA